MIEQLAVLFYGIMAMIFAALLASMTHSPWAMALIFAAAGVTYAYQFIQLQRVNEGLLWSMQLIVIGLTMASVAVSLAGSF